MTKHELTALKAYHRYLWRVRAGIQPHAEQERKEAELSDWRIAQMQVEAEEGINDN